MINETLVFAPFAFLFGACIGSFLNVVIYRLPMGEDLSYPGSHCYTCQKPIAWYDNVPVLAWFYLRGKCRCGDTPLSIRYPLVEFLTGVIWLGLYLVHGPTPLALIYCLLASAIIAVAFIDYDHMIIPDQISIPGIFIGVVLAGLGVLPVSLVESIGGIGFGFLFLGSVYYGSILILRKEGIGYGDVKYMMLTGAFMGWELTLFTAAAGAIIGVFTVIPLMALGAIKQGSPFPFGPFLVAAHLLALFIGEPFITWYTSMF